MTTSEYCPSSASTDQIIRIDKFEAEGWRPKHYFRVRHRILRTKQSLYDERCTDRDATGNHHDRGAANRVKGGSSASGAYGSSADHQRQFVYSRWREFLLQKRHKNLFTFAADRYGCRNNLQHLLMQYSSMYPAMTMDNLDNVGKLTQAPLHLRVPSNVSSRFANSSYDPEDDLRSQFEGAGDSPRSTISTDSMWSLSNVNRQTTSFAEHSIHEAYAFTGMHHIFDRPGVSGVAITRLKFGNNDSDLLAWASSDGSISIATVLRPEVVHILQGHRASVTDFDFSIDNHYLISVSKDGSIRVWDINRGCCIRVIHYKSSSSSGGGGGGGISGSGAGVNLRRTVPTCVSFYPSNNNIFLVGFSNRSLVFFNLSTGKPAFQSWKVASAVQSICFSPKGDLLFVGDANTNVYTYNVDHITGKARRLSKLQLLKKQKFPVTSLSYSEWTTAGHKAHPSLLVNVRGADAVYLFKVLSNGNLALEKIFPVRNRSETIRSVFCPLISFRNGACFVSGSETGEVLVFDLAASAFRGRDVYLASNRQPVINKLMGHASTVVDVSWDYRENILASCDTSGVVILWKRENRHPDTEERRDSATSSQISLTPLQRSAKDINVPESMRPS